MFFPKDIRLFGYSGVELYRYIGHRRNLGQLLEQSVVIGIGRNYRHRRY